MFNDDDNVLSFKKEPEKKPKIFKIRVLERHNVSQSLTFPGTTYKASN